MPFVIVLGRAGPAHFFILIIGIPVPVYRRQIIGVHQILGHESQFDERLVSRLYIGVYDLIIIGKIINRFPFFIFPVNIGGAELIRSVAVSRTEHEMGPEIIRRIPKRCELLKELDSFRNIGIIAFVIPDPSPQMFLGTDGCFGIHFHIYFLAHFPASSIQLLFFIFNSPIPSSFSSSAK